MCLLRKYADDGHVPMIAPIVLPTVRVCCRTMMMHSPMIIIITMKGISEAMKIYWILIYWPCRRRRYRRRQRQRKMQHIAILMPIKHSMQSKSIEKAKVSAAPICHRIRHILIAISHLHRHWHCHCRIPSTMPAIATIFRINHSGIVLIWHSLADHVLEVPSIWWTHIWMSCLMMI